MSRPFSSAPGSNPTWVSVHPWLPTLAVNPVTKRREDPPEQTTGKRRDEKPRRLCQLRPSRRRVRVGESPRL